MLKPPAPSPYYNHIMRIRRDFNGSLYMTKQGSHGWETIPGLARSKARIWGAIQRHHGSDKFLYFLVIALGMLETKTMNVRDRDSHKDHMGWQTANYTFLNACGDLIARAVPNNRYNLLALAGSPLNQDTDYQINEAINIVKGGIRNLGGIMPYCNFVRGGWSGWNNPGAKWEEYKMGQYFHGLSLTLQKIMSNENGIANTNSDRRLWVNVAYV
jgi:hypothetical protein